MNKPFKMKGSAFKKSKGYVATTVDPKNQPTMNRAFAQKTKEINSYMSKYNISKSKATNLWKKSKTS